MKSLGLPEGVKSLGVTSFDGRSETSPVSTNLGIGVGVWFIVCVRVIIRVWGSGHMYHKQFVSDGVATSSPLTSSPLTSSP